LRVQDNVREMLHRELQALPSPERAREVVREELRGSLDRFFTDLHASGALAVALRKPSPAATAVTDHHHGGRHSRHSGISSQGSALAPCCKDIVIGSGDRHLIWPQPKTGSDSAAVGEVSRATGTGEFMIEQLHHDPCIIRSELTFLGSDDHIRFTNNVCHNGGSNSNGH
jgi:hypothetical protein